MQIRLLACLLVFFCACKKYVDPAPFTDPRISNKYCNDPGAINYNWDFPGVPDNSVCIYPAEIYTGSYLFHDTTIHETGEYISNDSFIISFLDVDSTHMKITGFCGVNFHTAKANRFFNFTLDSLVGNGQTFCNGIDTIVGRGSKPGIQDTSTIQIIYQLHTDTGIVYHKGVAYKN